MKIFSRFKNINNKKRQIFPILLIVVLLALVTGVTYANWTKIFRTSEGTITSGLVSMSYTETSNIISISNALPMSDEDGLDQENGFEFSVNSKLKENKNNPYGVVNYSIELEVLDVDNDALNDNQIKVALYDTTLKSFMGSTLVLDPTLISNLEDIDNGKLLYSSSHTHTPELESATTSYLLLSWIDYNNSNAFEWENKQYEYKFRINISGDADALSGTVPVSNSCFEYTTNSTLGGVVITDYNCGIDSSIQQVSNSLNTSNVMTIPNYIDNNDNYKRLDNETEEVVTDVVIPEKLISKVHNIKAKSKSEITSDDKNECTNTFMKMIVGYEVGSDEYNEIYNENPEMVNSYQEVYSNICGGDESEGMTLDLLAQEMTVEYDYLSESNPEFYDLNVFYDDFISISLDVVGIDDNAFDNKGLTSVTIPNSVISIGDEAFYGNELTTLVIPNSVTEIGQSAFSNNNLVSVSLSNSITTIGFNTFSDNKLTSISIPDSVEYIGWYAFNSNELTSISIPDSVTAIGYNAFSNNKLTNINIPASVTSIYSYAFAWNDLTNINIPASVTSIEVATFAGNENLISITVDDNNNIYNDGNGSNVIIKTSTNTLIAGCKNSVIPNTVTTIASNAFNDMGIENIVIPESVKTIGYSAFSNNKLTNITLPNTLTSIERYVFSNNDLTSITIPESVTSIGREAFKNNDLTSVTIPASVTSIEVATFAGNENLISITVDDNNNIYNDGNGSNVIISTEDNTLIAGCKSSTIPNTVETIGFAAFYEMGVDNIIIPNSVVSIESYAFYKNNLTSINIPASVAAIDEIVFNGNENLTSITVDDNNTTYNDGNGSNVIISTEDNILVMGCKGSTIPNTVEIIGSESFYNMGIENITIPESIITIGWEAFENNKLTNITLPNTLTSIEGCAFANNYLTGIVIPDSVETIGSLAFGYNNLSYVVIGENSNLTENEGIDSDAFSSSDYVYFDEDNDNRSYPNNPNLTTIYNNSGKAFAWIGIIGGRYEDTTFVTGTVPSYRVSGTIYNQVIVTTGSPS